MKLTKPYNRIIRPFSLPNYYIQGYTADRTYIADDRYADERFEIIRAYHILEKDIIDLFDYIEPSDLNLGAFSYRTYELFLRASTEFELNARKILAANGYTKAGNMNIEDYSKVNVATKLNEYRLFINIWSNGRKEILPFSEWGHGHSLTWYQSYNSVKHNRHDKFHLASVENLIKAVAGVFSIIFSQFYSFTFNHLQPVTVINVDETTHELSSPNTLFSVILPQSWTENEMYEFDWTALRRNPNPIQNYPF